MFKVGDRVRPKKDNSDPAIADRELFKHTGIVVEICPERHNNHPLYLVDFQRNFGLATHIGGSYKVTLPEETGRYIYGYNLQLADEVDLFALKPDLQFKSVDDAMAAAEKLSQFLNVPVSIVHATTE